VGTRQPAYLSRFFKTFTEPAGTVAIMDTIFEYMTEAAGEAARIAAGVSPGQMSAPTPCAGWTVAELVNHWVLYTSHGLECRARRVPIPEDLTKRDFAGEPDWARSYAAQLDRALEAWRDPAAWEGEVDLGFTSSPATEIASLIVKEMVVHGWDVATATGQQVRCSPGLAAFILKVVDEHAGLYRQYDGFADPVATGPDATTLEQALAHSGREPGWAPPSRA
jgi:uncharacterized protein (TIGR03086 family)